MTGSIWIDFKPSDDTIPRILGLVADGGFALRDIRLIPCHNGERSSLCLDLADGPFDADLTALEQQLALLGDAIEAIHRAAARRV